MTDLTVIQLYYLAVLNKADSTLEDIIRQVVEKTKDKPNGMVTLLAMNRLVDRGLVLAIPMPQGKQFVTMFKITLSGYKAHEQIKNHVKELSKLKNPYI